MIMAVQRAPRLSLDDAAGIAAELYGLRSSAETLPSERDQNFLLRTAAGEKFVLKIANADEDFAVLDLQNQLIRFLAAARIDLEFPRIVSTKSGEEIASINGADGQNHSVRLLTWMEGKCFAGVPHDRKLLASLGRGLAQMDHALAGFSHPAAHRKFYWDLRSAAMARDLIELLPAKRRPLLDRFFAEWNQIDWSTLRCSVIHNDANDYNILVDGSASNARRVSAILDYGDVVHTATVCNLAVALAYVMLDKPDPISTVAPVVAAYHEIFPLTEAEVEVLYRLAVTRLCLSVCIAAKQTHDVPDNEYLKISNAPAWALLEKLQTVPLDWPTQVFRYACGIPVVKDQFSPPSESQSELITARRKSTGASLSLSYKSPLHIVSGSRQYLFDSSGRRYLDCVNNVAHVGHSHPFVVRAIAAQMQRLNTNTRYLHENLIEYTRRLTAMLPAPLSVVFLVNSGSEANELALRLARTHTSRNDVVVIDHAYHGNTSAMVDLSPYKFDGPGGRGRPPWVHKVPMPDVYRGEHRGEDAGTEYAREVTQAIQVAARNGGVAAFFCESAVSCGGQIILPPSFLREAFAAVRAAGGVCVADEVQTGFGRAGSRFWMFETQDVVPDIVTLGKPIGNGHPLGAVITTPEIAASFANGMEYFNTFGGNPVSCAAGLAVLDVIRDEELQQNALEVGEYLKVGLNQLKASHSLIGDTRGQGLFIGIELVRDRETLSPAATEAADLVEQMKQRGVLLSTDGPFHNVIKIKPPIVFSRHDADLLLSEMDAVLKDLTLK
jgi:4-aminobutyrate aminotransferase-like enzyme/Ser/Thr protein kinase RdoA (MazF antagonist)